MKFATVFSFLAAAGTMVSAMPATDDSKCIKPLLCCGELKTPLDSTVDPILKQLGIDAANIVDSIGLDCHAWDKSCESGPKCCTEANLLGGTVALGCEEYSS